MALRINRKALIAQPPVTVPTPAKAPTAYEAAVARTAELDAGARQAATVAKAAKTAKARPVIVAQDAPSSPAKTGGPRYIVKPAGLVNNVSTCWEVFDTVENWGVSGERSGHLPTVEAWCAKRNA